MHPNNYSFRIYKSLPRFEAAILDYRYKNLKIK